VLGGKPVIAMGATTGAWGTRLAQASLRQTGFATQAALMPRPALQLRSATDLFIEGRLVDEATRQSLSTQLVDFMQWMNGVRALLTPS
jgi:chromate reductase, NAD(P)H dehydrogenase (quinone)